MGFKDYARKTLSKLVLTHSKEVIGKIKQSNVNIVSFDIFDTLIKRHVQNPVDVFAILELEYKKSFNKANPIAKLRIEAEKRARELSRYEEVTIKEIYDQFVDVNYNEKQWLIEKEIYLERQLCVANRNFLSIYNWCKDNGINIVIVSDMYLPRKVIEEILVNAGYNAWSDLFISSEVRKQKCTGNLFAYVLSKLKICPEEVLHIGDSIKADYLMPQKLGINSILIKRKEESNELYKIRKNSLDDSILNSFIGNTMPEYDDYYSIIGYTVLGPLLLGYTKWLYTELTKSKFKKVFFLAREGALLNKAFETLYPNTVMVHNLIRVSRKSTALPRVYKAKNFKELLSYLVVSREYFSLNDLMRACCLSEHVRKLILNVTSIKGEVNLLKLPNDEQEHLFKIVMPVIKKVSEEQKVYIRGYLHGFDFDGKVAVADVGWHGTIQEALQDIFPENNIHGFYIGTKTKRNTEDVKNTHAYLFDKSSSSDLINEVMFSGSLFEMLFLSVDGSTICYKEEREGCYGPVLGKVEQIDDSIDKIMNLQNAALLFLKDVNQNYFISRHNFNKQSLFYHYKDMIYPPRFKIINLFKKFNACDVVESLLLPDKSIAHYSLHPISFKNDFLNNSCKIFFLKVIFKLPLPYFTLLSFMKKFDK